MKRILIEKKCRLLKGVHSDNRILSTGYNSMALVFSYPQDEKNKFISVYTARDDYERNPIENIDDAQAVFYYLTNDKKYLNNWTGHPYRGRRYGVRMAEEAIALIENSKGNFLKFSVHSKGEDKYGQ